MSARAAGLGWLAILRCGLVQTALGAIVVLTTSTLNRVMVVELALPAMLPGILVGLHYAVQLSRPRWGYGSDMGGRRTPWIVGGMAVLALGGALAAGATVLMASSTLLGVILATLAFVLIGAGVGAAGTSLLAFLATRVAPARRAPAATIVWLMMIAGMAVTATVAGSLLDPFSAARLLAVACAVAAAALVLTVLAVWGVERAHPPVSEAGVQPAAPAGPKPSFREAFAEVWDEPEARRFSVFVFFSMLAYSAQDLILEPFGGLVFAMTPGESTKLAGVQHGGVLVGMILVALACSGAARGRFGSLRSWTVVGCLASAVALGGLSLSGFVGPGAPIRATVFLLGMANGAFAVAAIGSMMRLASVGRARREGVRMGLWGAAQAIAFGLGGFLGAAAVDVTRRVFEAPEMAFGLVFAAEAGLFLISAVLAMRIAATASRCEGRTPAAAMPAE